MKKSLLFVVIAMTTTSFVFGQTAVRDTLNNNDRRSFLQNSQIFTSLNLEIGRVGVSENTSTLFSPPQQPNRAPAGTILNEGFEGTVGNELPEGWSRSTTAIGVWNDRTQSVDPVASPGWLITNDLRSPQGDGVTGLAARTGSRFAGLYTFLQEFRNPTAQTHADAWLFSPAMQLSAGTTYTLRFWTIVFGLPPNQFDRLKVHVGGTPTATAMATSPTIVNITNQRHDRWTLVTAQFTAPTTGTYHLAFHAYTLYAQGFFITLDDIWFGIGNAEPRNNDLAIISAPAYPYTQVPTSQRITPTHSAAVENIGLNPQTNVTLSVSHNGTPIGTSAPVASIAPGASQTISVNVGNSDVILGQNTLTYTVNQAQIDDDPSDNVRSVTFTGTANTFAVDNGNPGLHIGVTNGANQFSVGNIFQVTQPMRLDAVEVHFASANAYGFAVSLYTMNGNQLGTKIFTQPGSKPIGQGWQTIGVPATNLLPGSYFLCVDQTTATSVFVSTDREGTGYAIFPHTPNLTFGNLNTIAGSLLGAPLVRMLVDLKVNDLAIVPTGFPYTKIPTHQAAALPFPELNARALNLGTAMQTNVTLSVTYDGNLLGTSAPISMLGAFTTSGEMTVTPPAGMVFPTELGSKNVVYTVASAQVDEDPSNNSETFTFEITEKELAIDGVTSLEGGGMGVGTVNARLGNMFTISSRTVITGVRVGFTQTATPQNINIILYRRAATGLAIVATPLFTVPATRPDVAGWVDFPVPETVLIPGEYFLAIQEVNGHNSGLAYDRVPGRYLYFITSPTVNNLTASLLEGSLAIRMILDDLNQICQITPTVAEPLFYGFEDNRPLNRCWVSEPVGAGTANWEIVASNIGTPNTAAPDGGSFKARFVRPSGTGTPSAWLISPKLDLSNMDYPVLRFHHARQNGASLQAFYRTSTTGEWIPLSPNYVGAQVTWVQAEFPLPEISDDFYLAFLATSNGSNAMLDNIHLFDLGTYVDAELVSIITPVTGTFNSLTTSEEARIVIRNNGGAPLTAENCSIRVTINGVEQFIEPYAGNPIPHLRQDTVTLTNRLDLSGNTTYAITVEIVIDGDAIPANNSRNVSLTNRGCFVSVFPWNHGFEGNGNVLHQCLTNQRTVSTFDWVVVPASQINPVGTPDGSAHKANFIRTSGTTGAPPAARLFTSRMDISELTEPRLRFFYALQSAGSTIQAFYRTSATGAWIPLSAQFVGPTGNPLGWLEAEVVLPNPTNDYYIAFEASSANTSSRVSLDDITVFDLYGHVDGEIVSITTPTTGTHMDLTSSEPLTVVIRNNGQDPLTSANTTLKVEVNGTEVFSEPYGGSPIAYKAQATYTFTNRLDLSANGTHTITVTIDVPGDVAPGNNSQSVTLTNVACPVAPTKQNPWLYGFDDYTQPTLSPCWTNENVTTPTIGTSVWQIALSTLTATGTPGTAPNGGPNKARFSRTTTSPTVQSARLSSPKIDLSGMQKPMLRFHNSRTNVNATLQVQYRTSATGAWQNLGPLLNTAQTTWQEITLELPNRTSDYYIGFVASSNAAATWVQLDNIVVFDDVFSITTIPTPVSGGSTTGDGIFLENENVTLNADPNPGYHFVNWEEYSGSVLSTANPYTFPATKDMRILANFGENDKFYLTLQVKPNYTGQVFGYGSHSEGAFVTIEAVPETNYEFVAWVNEENEIVSTDNPYTFEMPEQDTILTALFQGVEKMISATVNYAIAGTVTGDGIYRFSETATLTATPDAIFDFVNWTEEDDVITGQFNVVGTDEVLVFTVTRDRALVANFEPKLKILSTVPEYNEDDVLVDVGIVINFNETITQGSAFSGITLNSPTGPVAAVANTAGGLLTITPNANLSTATTYTVNIPANAIVGFPVPIIWSFTTRLDPLVVQSRTPAVGGTNVAINAPVSITFNRTIVEGALSDISITYDAGDGFMDLSVSILDNVLTITPYDNFNYGVEYTVDVPGTAIYDKYGEFLGTQWSFTTRLEPLAITNTAPAHLSQDIPINAAASLTFNRAISAGNLSLVTITHSGGTLGAAQLNVGINDRVLTITPNANLAYNTLYTVNVPAGALNDSYGEFAGTQWSFTTRLQPLAMVSTTPLNLAQNVPINTPVSAVFNRAITAGNLQLITITGPGGVVGATVDVNNQTLTITPGSNLLHNTQYTVNVPAAALNDSYGEFTGIQWSFTTRLVPLTVIGTTPAHQSQGVQLNTPISVTFNRSFEVSTLSFITVTHSGGTISITPSHQNNIITIVPTGNLAHNTLYTVRIPQATINDPFGEFLGEEWTFTTRPAPLAVVSTTPAHGSNNTALNTEISVTFNRTVTSTATLIAGITINGGAISGNLYGNKLTITNPGLNHSTPYTVFVPASSIPDPFGEIQNVQWTFTTRDATSPVITTNLDTLNFGTQWNNTGNSTLPLQVTTQNVVTPLQVNLQQLTGNGFSHALAPGWNNLLGGTINVTFAPTGAGMMSHSGRLSIQTGTIDPEIVWLIGSSMGGGGTNIVVEQDMSVSVYPNPTKDVLHIKSERPVSYLLVYNQQGQLVARRDGENQIDLQHLPSGTYIVRIIFQNNEVVTLSVIKN